MAGAHSDAPPSGAPIYRRCPAWIPANKRFPRPDTPESMEGTAAHWVTWEVLAGRPVQEGNIAPNGVIVTAEMLDGAALFVETVRTNPALTSLPFYVEQPVAIPMIHPACWGTPDFFAWDATHSALWLIDYKFGHRFVDEFENEQLIEYAAGIMHALGIDPNKAKVYAAIVQPRCYYRGSPVRLWQFRMPDVAHIVGELQQAVAEGLGPNPTARPNSGCYDCPGRHACQALQRAAYSDTEFALQSPPVELSPEAADLELRMLERGLERLEARVEGLREQVSAYVRQGARTPFHRLAQSDGKLIWTIPPGQVVAVGAMYGKDLSKQGCMTPTQAKAAGVDASVISAYSIRQPGSIKLIPENPADVRKVFGTN